MQAIVIDPAAPMRLGFQTVAPPTPQANEAVVRVSSISLNRGEVVYRVEQAAANGSGPAQGTRVVGVTMEPSTAWAEFVAVPVAMFQ